MRAMEDRERDRVNVVSLRDAALFLIRDYQAFVNTPNEFCREQAIRAVQDIVVRLLVAVANDRAAPQNPENI